MVIRSETNRYPGVNPHLNSALQQPGGGWKSFHAYHIIYLAETLNSVLPPSYYARPEESIQISIYDAEMLPLSTRTLTVDVLITGGSYPSEQSSVALPGNTPTLTLPIPQLVDEEDQLTALVIYQEDRPVTRIELLSPANKPGGSHNADYMLKRAETLVAGLPLVEIDYLHERHPSLPGVPSYKARHSRAFPYYIFITDPRPSLRQGRIEVYGWGVLDPLPILSLPLGEKDTVRLDFGAVYNRTFSQHPFCRSVDYSQEPVNFAAYTDADQTRIRQHMAAIAADQTNP